MAADVLHTAVDALADGAIQAMECLDHRYRDNPEGGTCFSDDKLPAADMCGRCTAVHHLIEARAILKQIGVTPYLCAVPACAKCAQHGSDFCKPHDNDPVRDSIAAAFLFLEKETRPDA